MKPVIFAVTGPPGAGKTSVSRALLSHFAQGVHLEVDALRGMVVVGMSDSVPEWTDETERQFQLAEAAACDLAVRYFDAGMSVAIDHCRNLPRWDQFLAAHLGDRPVVRVLLLPPIDINLERNRRRTNKPFDPVVLEDIVHHMNQRYLTEISPRWTLIQNEEASASELAAQILREHCGRQSGT